MFASCGTRVVAARGGKVQARGSDPVLYGNWVVIDGRGTQTDYRYAHFLHPASVHDGERVRTGERIGRVGKTGNARTVGCQLHFEVWPHGLGARPPHRPASDPQALGPLELASSAPDCPRRRPSAQGAAR